MTAAEFVQAAQAALEPQRDPARATRMAAYMKNHFVFLGVPAPAQRAACKPLWPKKSSVNATWVHEVSSALMALPEREYHYAAVAAMQRHVATLGPDDLEPLTALVLERAWWDTIDAFAAYVAGALLARLPSLTPAMDTMSAHPNLWRRRVAILHQLAYKDRTDWDRLCRYALHNASHESFWVRKSLGWAFREYARVDAEAVLGFFGEYGGRFSGLTRREALKHLGR
jgi:3-methyladenine DNA glycosylase AlkD